MIDLRSLRQYGIVASIAFSLVACTEGSHGVEDVVKPPVEEEPEKPPVEEPPVEEPPVEEPPEEDPPEEDPPEDTTSKGVLIAMIPTDVKVAHNGSVNLQVKFVSTDPETPGAGVVGKRIRWEIESGGDYIGIQTRSGVTQGEGIASKKVESKRADVENVHKAVIVVSSEDAAAPVRFNITVLAKPKGNLQINAVYEEGIAPVDYYEIRVYDGRDVICSSVDLMTGEATNRETGEPAEPVRDPVQDSSAYFPELSTDWGYTAVALGYSRETGALVASGCLDTNLKVEADKTTSGTVYMNTLMLNPASRYRVRSYFDLGDVLSALGTTGALITRVLDFATNPGKALYVGITSAISKFFNGAAADALAGLLSLFGADDYLINFINDLLMKSDVICKAGVFACQMRDLVRLMEFIGYLDIQKVGKVALTGNDSYQGFAVYWRLGCDGTDDNCGRHVLTTEMLEQIEGSQIDDTIPFLSGTWSGSLANGYDKLSVEAHELRLYYGKIIVYMIEKILLPKLTGGNVSEFENLLPYWVDCKGIGAWIHEKFEKANSGFWDWVIPDSLVPSQQGAENFCNSAVSGLSGAFGFVEAWAEMQSAGSDIKISGTAKLRDTNGDNIVDDIVDGTWSGSMTVTTKGKDNDNNPTSIKVTTAVEGIWSAYNDCNVGAEESAVCKPPKSDRSVMYCTQDKSMSDTEVNKKCAYPAIDRSKLSSGGLCERFQRCANPQ